MANTTTQRSRNLLTKNHYQFDTVERWISQRRIRIDFCNFADIIAFGPFHPDLEPIPGCLAVQTCATSTISTHIKKLTSPPIADRIGQWIDSGNRLEIWGWGKHTRKRLGKSPIVRPTFRILTADKLGFYTLSSTELWNTP